MVVLESEEEIKEVAKITADLGWFWIDGKMIDGVWKTNKGEKIPSFTPWGENPGVEGDCIRTGADTKWYRVSCTSIMTGGNTISAFCKKPLVGSTVAKLKEGRWISISSYLIKA